ncbi:MAG: DNA-3-methyladenine glycosylase [Methanomethylovorans sp.]|uniref:DNA-3-methyladenine glycosylase family protein n=1 Tax=Methanomethylovorans sp. TaxID=2758717 RepID=UPI003531751E
MYTLYCDDFNLDYTLDCGQVFRWDKIGDVWTGVVQGDVVRAWQDLQTGVVQIDSKLPEDFFRNYFRFDDDLGSILEAVNKDKYMDEAIRGYRGMRLIRQDPWECLISYILATAWSIPNIKNGISKISHIFGEEIAEGYYSFPKPGALAIACDSDLCDCRLGFRTNRIRKAAAQVVDGDINLDEIFELDYEAAKKKLMVLDGIGEKVADCILLFAFEKMEAFPVDTHVEKVIRTYYGNHEFFNNGMTKTKIGTWGRLYFGKYCGYAQQYLFYQKRLEGLK